MHELLRERLDQITLRLALLRQLDPPQPEGSNLIDEDGRRMDGYVMFGADQHQYRNYPLGEEHLGQLEARMGCVLPEDFRAFLTEIGLGAGPYYGIGWRMLERSATASCARAFPNGETGPIYLDETGDEEIEDGYLLISDIGCGDLVGLVTAGPARGRVVFLIYNRDEWSLGPDFLTYYAAWIERGIAQLSSDAKPRMIV